MNKLSVIAIFDIGKTNKKLFLFNEHYRIVYEKNERLPEATDEDGFPCENIDSLRLFVLESLSEIVNDERFDIKAINFSAYGASLVNIDDKGVSLSPLYNYLKPFPETLEKTFYTKYGGKEKISLETASPCLGSLNSGLQLYRIKEEQSALFGKMKYALHLPQYLSALITEKFYSDITSIGCHTHLWNFREDAYHHWVTAENLVEKLAPVFPSDKIIPTNFLGKKYAAGVGLHDSSAALIPYLASFKEPFLLISTGTWCISLNPFNEAPLTKEELENDCLCFINYQGKPVKASRMLAGYFHEAQTERIAAHFHTGAAAFGNMIFKKEIIEQLNKKNFATDFSVNDLSQYENTEEAYHHLMMELIEKQYLSTDRIFQKEKIKKIFVDGGFGKNNIYMNLLARAFREVEVYAASMAQATALGAAMAIHSGWNTLPLPDNIVQLTCYEPAV